MATIIISVNKCVRLCLIYSLFFPRRFSLFRHADQFHLSHSIRYLLCHCRTDFFGFFSSVCIFYFCFAVMIQAIHTSSINYTVKGAHVMHAKILYENECISLANNNIPLKKNVYIYFLTMNEKILYINK